VRGDALHAQGDIILWLGHLFVMLVQQDIILIKDHLNVIFVLGEHILVKNHPNVHNARLDGILYKGLLVV
jgi:hypothetical protein